MARLISILFILLLQACDTTYKVEALIYEDLDGIEEVETPNYEVKLSGSGFYLYPTDRINLPPNEVVIRDTHKFVGIEMEYQKGYSVFNVESNDYYYSFYGNGDGLFLIRLDQEIGASLIIIIDNETVRF